MALAAYRLRPLAPFHLGRGRAGDLADVDDLPRSDTIAAALISLWRNVNPGADVAMIAASPPFAVSSALPTLRDATGTWEALLPMPVGLAAKTSGSPSEHKVLQRARHIGASILDDLLGGGALRDFKVLNDCILGSELARAYGDGLWQSESRLRLAVNRLGDGPIPELLYEFGAVYFDRNVRLTVVVAFDDEAIRRQFEAALRLLGDEGIGADRSAGYGRFEVEGCDSFAPLPGGGMRMTLSLMHPTKEDIGEGLLDHPASYKMVTRGGWVTTPGARTLRKQNVRMISEGSVVNDLGRKSCGDSPKVLDPIPDLGLHHAVYRPGVSVTVPIKWEG